MSRGFGVSTAGADALEPLEPLFVIITQTGDTWLLGVVIALLYVLGDGASLSGWDRRRGATVLAAGLLAIAVTGLLKAGFGLPRPPGAAEPSYAFGGVLGDVYAWAGTAEGDGFPSGHAVGSAAVYGTIAGLVARRDRRRAAAAAAGLMAVAALSRVALGVHYLVDSVAGVAVGLLLAGLAIRVVDRPAVPLATAVPAAAGWVVLADGPPTALGVLGLSAGALLAWTTLDERLVALPRPSGTATAGLAVGGVAVAGATVAVIETGGTATAGLAGLLGMGLLMALPLAVRGRGAVSVGEETAQKVSR
jgi:membrane-associated phospholipid phosphatase